MSYEMDFQNRLRFEQSGGSLMGKSAKGRIETRRISIPGQTGRIELLFSSQLTSRSTASSFSNFASVGSWGSVRRFPLGFVIRNFMEGIGLGFVSMGLGLVARRNAWE